MKVPVDFDRWLCYGSCQMTRRELIAFATAAPIAFADNEKSILGAGWGLDHIEIVVSSGEAAKETYFRKLGFTVSPDASVAGVQRSGIFFGPPYIEFFWLRGVGKPELESPLALKLRRSLDHGGGIFQYNIDTSNIETVRERLSGMGLNVNLQQPRTRTRNGKEEPAAWRLLYAKDERAAPPPGVPGGDAVGIIEYRDNSVSARLEQVRQNFLPSDLPKDPRRAAGEDHANTARRLRAVLVAVPDVGAAVAKSVSFGLVAAGKRQSSAIGAVGQQVECGQGYIEFWEPASRDGQLATLLRQKGPGPFGFAVGVASVGIAHDIAQEGFQTKLPIEDQHDRRSLTVSGSLTDGVWVEFVQL